MSFVFGGWVYWATMCGECGVGGWRVGKGGCVGCVGHWVGCVGRCVGWVCGCVGVCRLEFPIESETGIVVSEACRCIFYVCIFMCMRMWIYYLVYM